MKIPFEERLEYYLGDINWGDKPPKSFDLDPFDLPFELDPNKTILSRRHYDKDILRLTYLSAKRKLWFCCGDKPYCGSNFPVITKTRDTFNLESKGVIGNLNSGRHWDIFHEEPKWEDKVPSIYWRGADTGHNLHLNPRVDFVQEFFGKFDVGFSDYSQNQKQKCYLYKKEWLLGFSSRADFLAHKYLPIIDGNDKSSSLNWALYSNSVPIMPKPRYHSWTCEKHLLSNVHYIEVKRDFSDLEEKVEWLKDNDKKAKEIAENGKEFIIKNFTDMEQEREIEKALLDKIETHL